MEQEDIDLENEIPATGIDSIDLDEVLEVIQTQDPAAATAMFQNGGDPHLANTNNAQLNPNNNNITNNNNGNSVVSSSNSLRRSAVVKIVEQPASKALRFRYECEGRSAGSIPGVNSTPENKTYPSIQVNGYRGRAVVVVSCVTKDAPYRPHPHNLVGKDGCKKGVCTVEINSANMAVTFSNLGIQCVKKKDIEEALKQREEIRVDPFRTGFSHRQQPSTIDLNAVRLCFQVFLEGETRGRFTVPLPPVVSDIIYDKKAMSDLVICKLSDCSCSVAGGREIILLCEKVAKEDISVRFYEERDGHLYWEGLGEFQHTNVHKQVAISFRTPRYKTLEIDQPVKAYIQLKRPTDGATSEPLPFEFLPLDSGRRRIWSLRTDVLKRQVLQSQEEMFNQVLSDDLKAQKKPEEEVILLDTPVVEEKPILQVEKKLPAEIKTTEWIRQNEFDEINNNVVIENGHNLMNGVDNGEMDTKDDDDTSLNELLEQVAELDEIYTDHQVRRENLIIENELKNFVNSVPSAIEAEKMEIDDIFDDAATYTSLQRAFKNPLEITLAPPVPTRPQYNHLSLDPGVYDAVEPGIIINPPTPLIDIGSLKRENIEDEKLPPLPPKRAKPNLQNNKENEQNILATIIRRDSNRSLTPRPQSQIIILKMDDGPPNKKLPPTPPASPKKVESSTLPRQKKPGFFSKLFSRKKSKADLSSSTNTLTKETPTESEANSEATEETKSVKDTKVDGKVGKPVFRSVSSVSGKRPNMSNNPHVIHIPLKDDDSSNTTMPMKGSNTQLSLKHFDTLKSGSHASLTPISGKTLSALQLANIPIKDGDKELVALTDAQSLRNLCLGDYGVKLDPSIDLTEAEHYALYTSIAPHATASEFDETSCYYAAVEAGEILKKN